MKIQLAFDRSMRTVDPDGRLHVELSNISKAVVNPYLGREIPDSEAMGLEPDRVYMLYRDPEELARAAGSFNNLPVLTKHIAFGIGDVPKESIVGSTGTDAVWQAPYLCNSLVVWDAIAIAGINLREQCELSSAYRYRADMTPGTVDGVAYDGVMRDIIGHHVAIVETGRAGPDVVVGDSLPEIFVKPTELITMKLSRTAVAVNAAIGAYITPRLAADAAIGDTKAFVRGVKAASFATDKPRVIADVCKKFDGIKPEELGRVLQLAADSVEDDVEIAEDDDAQKDGESDEDYKKRMDAKKLAADGDDEGKDKPMDKTAMDAAINKGIQTGMASLAANMAAIRTAEAEVLPVIGQVIAMDSAPKVYKLALDHLKIDVTGVDPSAYGAMFRLASKAPAENVKSPRIALDAGSATDFAARFPTAGVLKRGV